MIVTLTLEEIKDSLSIAEDCRPELPPSVMGAQTMINAPFLPDHHHFPSPASLSCPPADFSPVAIVWILPHPPFSLCHFALLLSLYLFPPSLCHPSPCALLALWPGRWVFFFFFLQLLHTFTSPLFSCSLHASRSSLIPTAPWHAHNHTVSLSLCLSLSLALSFPADVWELASWVEDFPSLPVLSTCLQPWMVRTLCFSSWLAVWCLVCPWEANGGGVVRVERERDKEREREMGVDRWAAVVSCPFL